MSKQVLRRAAVTSSLARWFASQADAGIGFPLLFALLTLLPFYSLLIPNGDVIPFNTYSDYTTYQLPVHKFVRSEILAGRFPHWIPNLACGLPLHATQQAAICYPLLTPLILVFGANYGIKLSLFLHLALAFAGTYRLARLLDLTRFSSTFAAAVSTQNAYLIAHLMEGHISHVFAYALAPWFFWALIRLLHSPSGVSSLVLCWITSSMLLTGQPQLPYYSLLFGTFWWLGSWVFGEGSRHRWRCFMWSSISIINCLLLVCIQWLPVLELLQNSLRMSDRGSPDYASTISLNGVDFLLWLMPNLFGNQFVGLPEFRPPYYFHERVGYLGMATLLLAGFSLTRKDARLWQWGILAMTALGLLIALGNNTPFFLVLMQLLPGLNYFRCPGRIQSMLAILIPLLAAKGLDALIWDRSPRATFRQLIFCGLILAGAFGGWIAISLSDMQVLYSNEFVKYQSLYFPQHLWLGGSTLLNLLMALGMTVLFRKESPRVSLLAILLVSQLDLLSNNTRNFKLTPPYPISPQPVIGKTEESMRYIESPFNIQKLRSDSIRYSKSVPLAIHHDLVLIGTNEGGVLPQATEHLFRSIEINPEISLDFAGCDYYLNPQTGGWTQAVTGLPDVYFLPGSAPNEINTPLVLLTKATFHRVFGQFTTNNLHIMSQQTTSIHLELIAEQPGMLVISQIAYPGWRCKVNGIEEPIESMHDVFQTISISRGKNQIQITYKPTSFYLGCCFSLIGIGMSVMILIARQKKFIRFD